MADSLLDDKLIIYADGISVSTDIGDGRPSLVGGSTWRSTCLYSPIYVGFEGNQLILIDLNGRIKKTFEYGPTFQGSMIDCTLLSNTSEYTQQTSIQIDSQSVIMIDKPNHILVKYDCNFQTRQIIAGRSMIAGYRDGPTHSSLLNSPSCIIQPNHSTLIICEPLNNSIRRIHSFAFIETLAGGLNGLQDGAGHSSRFSHPICCAVDPNDQNQIVVVEVFNHTLRRITDHLMPQFNQLRNQTSISIIHRYLVHTFFKPHSIGYNQAKQHFDQLLLKFQK